MNTGKQIVRFINTEVLHGERFKGDPLAAGVIDSLGLEQLIAFIEEEFDVILDDDDLQPEHFAKLDAIVALVESKQRSKP